MSVLAAIAVVCMFAAFCVLTVCNAAAQYDRALEMLERENEVAP